MARQAANIITGLFSDAQVVLYTKIFPVHPPDFSDKVGSSLAWGVPWRGVHDRSQHYFCLVSDYNRQCQVSVCPGHGVSSNCISVLLLLNLEDWYSCDYYVGNPIESDIRTNNWWSIVKCKITQILAASMFTWEVMDFITLSAIELIFNLMSCFCKFTNMSSLLCDVFGLYHLGSVSEGMKGSSSPDACWKYNLGFLFSFYYQFWLVMI